MGCDMRHVTIVSVLVAMMLGAVGCNREPDYSAMIDYEKREACYWRILDGRGEEALGPKGEDSFTLFQEMLFSPGP